MFRSASGAISASKIRPTAPGHHWRLQQTRATEETNTSRHRPLPSPPGARCCISNLCGYPTLSSLTRLGTVLVHAGPAGSAFVHTEPAEDRARSHELCRPVGSVQTGQMSTPAARTSQWVGRSAVPVPYRVFRAGRPAVRL